MLFSLSGLLCLLGGSADTGYLYQRIWLSVTVFTSVILLSLVLVDDYLISFALLEDLSLNSISLYEWCAYDKLVTAYSYDFVKYYCIAYVGIEFLNSELVSLLYSVLLATCLDDSIHNIKFLLKPDSPEFGCYA